MKNTLFNDSTIDQAIAKNEKNLKISHRQKESVLWWCEKLDNDELIDEKRNYLNFSDKILTNLLGYTNDLDYKHEINLNNQFVEFILYKNDEPFVVVELKGSKTSLDKKVNNESPVQQGFRYVSLKSSIKWIILSNYKEIRLYNQDTQNKFVSFDFSELKNEDALKRFLLIFSKEFLLENKVDELYKNTKFIEKNFEKEFYNLYSETRLMLIKELESTSKMKRNGAIAIAQLILNRYIFICFAEDLGLLPSEISADTLLTPIEHKDLHKNTLINRLNELSLYLNEGNAIKGIDEFNGGLFEKDLLDIKIRDIVDDQESFFKDCNKKWNFTDYANEINNKIGDDYRNKINPIFRNLLIISSFNFKSELDVNILGHIFENSIGDLEDLKESNEKGRRKKDGVFYTPDQITDYICKNTIIPYLSKDERVTTVPELVNQYLGSEIDKLDQKLKNIKIVDPACGSGAFLNKATDILLELHKAVHEKKYEGDETLQRHFDNITERRNILLNNIYGVDLNEESIEITKLSLFLKVCKKGLKLPNLDENIKCGNSLINSEKYTDKLFNWEKEFKQVFEEDGFDIVIGNPPYVRQEKIKEFKPYFKDNYKTYTGVADLYVYFFEKGLNLLRDDGYLAFICSNKYTRANYGKNLRNLILKNNIINYNDYTGENIFADATVDPSVIIINKSDSYEDILINNDFWMDQNRLDDGSWSFEPPEILNLKDKIMSKGTKIKDIDEIIINRGILTGFNEAFIIDEKTRNDLIAKDPKNMEIIKPLLRGRDIKQLNIDHRDLYLLYIPWEFEIEKHPSIKEYLDIFKEKLSKRPEVKSGRYGWCCLSRYASDYVNDFDKPKLIYPVVSTNLFMFYDDNSFYINDKAFMLTSDLNLKYLMLILSSKLMNFYFKLLGSPLGKTGYELRKIYIEKLPIILPTDKQEKTLADLAIEIILKNKKLTDEIKSFHKYLISDFNVAKINKKFTDYYNLSFDDLYKEVKKQYKKINRREKDKLEEEYIDSINIIGPLKNQIKAIDEEINRLVYELYDLTDDEIAIVENTL